METYLLRPTLVLLTRPAGPEEGTLSGVVSHIIFKGVHYEILIETELRTYMVHTTDYAEVGREVGLKFGPEDIHVMCKMGSY